MFTSHFPQFFALFTSLILVFSACDEPEDIHIHYSQDSTATGQIYLIPDLPTALTFVVMNDEILVENKYLRSVTIYGVPIGDHRIQYSSGDPKLSYKLNEIIDISMEDSGCESRVVPVPPYSSGFWTKLGLNDVSGSIYYLAGFLYLAFLLL